MDILDGGELKISDKPVRRVIRRSSAVSNGTFRTYKHPSRSVTFLPGESNNELAFLRFAEMDSSVTQVLAQPTVIRATHDGKVVQQTPDYAICLCGRRTIVEVKSTRAFVDVDLRRKLDTFAYSAKGTGWDYLVVLGGDLIESPFWRPVDSLWRSHRRTYEHAHLVAVTNLLLRGAQRIDEVVATLRTRMGASAPEIRHLLSMAAGNRVLIDLEPGKVVGADSVVHMLDPGNQPSTFIPFRRPPFAVELER